MPVPGRPSGELRGSTEAVNRLAGWLRTVTDGVSVRELATRFGGNKNQWSEYRSGAKIIPRETLAKVVTELAPAPRREHRLAIARGLWDDATKSVGIPRPSSRPTGGGLELVRLHEQLNQAVQQQLEAERARHQTQPLLQALMMLVGWLQGKVTALELERDRPRPEEQAQAERGALDRALDQLRRTEEQLERAKRERFAAETLQQKAMQAAETVRRKLAALQDRFAEFESRSPSQPETLPAPAAPRDPSLDEAEAYLQRLSSGLDDQEEDLTRLGSEMGYGDQAPKPQVIQGIVLNEDSTDRRVLPDNEASRLASNSRLVYTSNSFVPQPLEDNGDIPSTSGEAAVRLSRTQRRAGKHRASTAGRGTGRQRRPSPVERPKAGSSGGKEADAQVAVFDTDQSPAGRPSVERRAQQDRLQQLAKVKDARVERLLAVFMPSGLAARNAVVMSWLAGEGRRVEPGQPMLEAWTDGGTLTLSAPFPGVLEQIAVQPGRAVSSGEVLAHVRTRALLPEESTDSSGFPAWGELPAGELSRPEAVEDATALQEERPVEPSDLDLTQLGSEIGYEDPAPDPHVIQGIVLNEGTTGRLPPEDQAPPVPGPASVVPPETRDNQDNAATSFDPSPNPSRPGGRAGDEDGPPSRPRNRPAPRTRSTLDRTDTKPTSLLNDMISSPRYTDPVVRAFLSNLRNAFASSAVTYADAVRAADDPAALKAFCAGSFPSLALTRSLVPLFHGDMDLWTGRWKAASRQPMRKERGAVRKTIGLIFRR